MDINNMRNTVVLKNLPSNLIEEAVVILKENCKIKKLEYVDNNFENARCDNDEEENENEFIVKEAELLVSDYITKLENQDIRGNKFNSEIARKYKKTKVLSIILSCFLFVSFLYILIS